MPALGTTMSMPPKRAQVRATQSATLASDAGERLEHRERGAAVLGHFDDGGVGHVDGLRREARRAVRARETPADRVEPLSRQVGEHDVGAGPEQLVGDPAADRTSAAGDERDLAGERRARGLAELGLLERPVLHVEQVFGRQRPVRADGRGERLAAQRVLGDVSGDPRGLRVVPERADTEALDDRHPRLGIEHRRRLGGTVPAGIEVPAVGIHVARDRGAQRRRVPQLFGADEQVGALGAQHVVRGQRPGRAERRSILAERERDEVPRRPRVGDEPTRAIFSADRDRAAEPRQEVGRRSTRTRRRHDVDAPDRARRREALCAGAVLHHPHVAGLRIVGEGEDPVVQQHDRLARRPHRLERVRHGLGERMAGHDPRQDRHAVAERVADQRLSIRLVGEHADRVRVRVVDEPVRQECVEQRLDGRRGRGRVEQSRADAVHHLLVGEPGDTAEAAQPPGGPPARSSRGPSRCPSRRGPRGPRRSPRRGQPS